MEVDVLTPVPAKEYERLMELFDLDLDYGGLNEELNDLTRLAAKAADTPIALVNILDANTVWTVAGYGIGVGQIPRTESVCQFTVLDNIPFEVKNLQADERFSGQGLLRENPELCYYYGQPLITPHGFKIGTLVVFDSSSATLSEKQKDMLAIIADEIVARLFDVKERNELKRKLDEEAAKKRSLSHDLRGPVGGIIGLSQIIKEQGEGNNLEGVLEMIEMIHDGGETILEKIKDTLSGQKKSGMKREPEAHEFTLKSLRAKLEQLFTPQAVAKNVDLTIANHSTNEEVPFHKRRLLQIVGSLISRTIKCTPADGMVMVRMEFKLSASGDVLLVTIKNTSTANEHCEPFMETGEDEQPVELSLVEKFVEEAAGKLEVSLEEGQEGHVDLTYPL